MEGENVVLKAAGEQRVVGTERKRRVRASLDNVVAKSEECGYLV